jgi:hypothetical protein
MGDLISMFDSIDPELIPADAPAVAGYVGGDWATFAGLAERFPHAQRLSIAVNAGEDAECLDVETGDATAAEIPDWLERQRGRGVARPCIYANAFTMEASVLPVLAAAKIARASVRLWSAHYSTAHICGPSSCKAVSIDMDATQWTQDAEGRDLDQSLLVADFFAVPAPPAAKPTVASGPRPVIADGKQTLAQIARAHGTVASAILRVTAESSPNREFSAEASQFIDGMAARDTQPVPAGLSLFLPG